MSLKTIATEAEGSVIGGMLITCEPWPPEVDALTPDDFASPIHAAVFAACVLLRDAQEPVDEVTVLGQLQARESQPPPKGWVAVIGELTDAVPTAANLAHYAKLVRKESRRRSTCRALDGALQDLTHDGADSDGVLSEVSMTLASLSSGRDVARAYSMREVVLEQHREMQNRKPGDIIGVSSGFANLDRLLGGLAPGTLSVIAARPSMGKSSLMRNILCQQTTHGSLNALLFSHEMTRAEIGMAMISSESRYSLHKIRTGRIEHGAWKAISEAAGRLGNDRLHIVDKVLSISDIRSLARNLHARDRLDVVAVDYLQLVVGEGDNREQEVASISRGLKGLAAELGCVVIALSQLNRSVEQRPDKRPMLSDLRESGAVEQDADQVTFIYRDDYYNHDSDKPGIAEVRVAKNRNGPTGMVELRWSNSIVRFDEMDSNQPSHGEDTEEEAA